MVETSKNVNVNIKQFSIVGAPFPNNNIFVLLISENHEYQKNNRFFGCGM